MEIRQTVQKSYSLEQMILFYIQTGQPDCLRELTEVTGVTLTRYIMTEKVTEAKRLLLFTDKNLSDISMYLSFSSQSHFQTTLKKITLYHK